VHLLRELQLLRELVCELLHGESQLAVFTLQHSAQVQQVLVVVAVDTTPLISASYQAGASIAA
jgi:hypothetical protein